MAERENRREGRRDDRRSDAREETPEFADRLGFSLRNDRDFETVAGFVIDTMGTLPDVGDVITHAGWRIEVVDLDGRRIDKILVTRAA